MLTTTQILLRDSLPTIDMSTCKVADDIKQHRLSDGTVSTIASDESNIGDLSSMTSASKTVCFDKVEFREYARCISDNPSISCGPAIGLSWNYDPEATVTLDIGAYEISKELAGSPFNCIDDSDIFLGNDTKDFPIFPRREKRELIMPASLRRQWLLELGYSEHEINQVVKTAEKERAARYNSLRLRKYDSLIEKVDGAKQKLKKFSLRKGKSV